MKIRIKDIPAEGQERDLELSPSWFESTLNGVEGSWDQARGHVHLRLSRKGADVLVRGDFAADLKVPCARCLESATVEIRSQFASDFVPAGSPASAAKEEGSPDIETYTGDEIELSDLLREQVVLGIPMSALCRPECKGLCPQCGKELNLGACSCQPPSDPRWEALRKARTP